jgi:hypothetical protein
MNHQEYVESLKSSAIKLGKDLLVREVKKRLPFLFLPVLNPITGYVIGKGVEILINHTEMAIFFFYIDMRVDKQAASFSQAAINNYKAQQSGSEYAKLEAEKALIKSFRELVILRM